MFSLKEKKITICCYLCLWIPNQTSKFLSASLVYLLVAPPHRKPIGFRSELVKKDVLLPWEQPPDYVFYYLFVLFFSVLFVVVFVFLLRTTFSINIPSLVQSCQIATVVIKLAPTETRTSTSIEYRDQDEDQTRTVGVPDQDLIYQRQIRKDQKKIIGILFFSFFLIHVSF